MFDLVRNNGLLGSYNPFREMEEMERNFFTGGSIAEFKTDITDEGDSYLLEADLPGFKKEDINLDLSGDVLTIHAERHSKVEDKDQKDKVVRVERSYGSYSRQFNITGIDAEKISAKYEDGVLKLNLPKMVERAPESRRLMIE